MLLDRLLIKPHKINKLLSKLLFGQPQLFELLYILKSVLFEI